MVDFRAFTRETLPDAKTVVGEVFGEGTCEILDKILENPALNEVEQANAGEIVYVDSKPVGFNAAILRKLFLGKKPLWGIVGSTLGLLPAARKNMVALDLMSKIVKPRSGSVLFFGNSANKSGMRLNKAFGMVAHGPDSCGEKRLRIIRPFRFLVGKVCRILFPDKGHDKRVNTRSIYPVKRIGGYEVSRERCIDSRAFDEFWKRYLSGNEGLVCSRSSRELQWLFGDGIENGRNQMYAIREGAAIKGYVVYGSLGYARCMCVLDMLVENNSVNVLEILLRSSLKMLRRVCNADYCQVSGFPDFIQDALSKCFPIARTLTNNQFAWKWQAGYEVSEDIMKDRRSWFFGPYDGDNCML